MLETNEELVSRFITADYKGIDDQKRCAVELMERVSKQELTLAEVIFLIYERKI